MMGGAEKRYKAAAYDERQPAPPRRSLKKLLLSINCQCLFINQIYPYFICANVYIYSPFIITYRNQV